MEIPSKFTDVLLYLVEDAKRSEMDGEQQENINNKILALFYRISF